MKVNTFNDVLEKVELLPEEQKESLIEILQHRLIEERRNRLAKNIKKAKEDYRHGKVRRGTVDDLMREIAG